MNLIEAERVARKLMGEHGLTAQGWNFEFDRATSRLGATHFHKKTITISKYMAGAATLGTVIQVVLHEIAHVKVGKKFKTNGKFDAHGTEWKQIAASIGYKGGRTMTNPYQGKKTSRRKTPFRPAMVSSNPVGIGTKLQIKPNVTAEIFKKATTRYHAIGSDGRTYTVRFEAAAKYAIS